MSSARTAGWAGTVRKNIRDESERCLASARLGAEEGLPTHQFANTAAKVSGTMIDAVVELRKQDELKVLRKKVFTLRTTIGERPSPYLETPL